MSQILSTIQKKKTFAEICPIWDEKIESGNMDSDHLIIDGEMRHIHLANPRCCIVGEAHGFKDSGNGFFYDGFYNCKDCQKFSEVLFETAIATDYQGHPTGIYGSTPEFEYHKDEFVSHWNECHIR